MGTALDDSFRRLAAKIYMLPNPRAFFRLTVLPYTQVMVLPTLFLGRIALTIAV
jgi:hypothetical protein